MGIKKQIALTVGNTGQYIRLFNCIFNLTDTEIHVLSLFIDHADGNNIFSMNNREKILEHLGTPSMSYLNVYVAKLKEKHALIQLDRGSYTINPILIPGEETEIIFQLKRNGKATTETNKH